MARKNYNIDEMRALKLAYDSDITRNDKFRYYVMPAILVMVAVFIVMTPRIALTWQQEVPGVGQPEYIKSDYPTIPLQKSGRLDGGQVSDFLHKLDSVPKTNGEPNYMSVTQFETKKKAYQDAIKSKRKQPDRKFTPGHYKVVGDYAYRVAQKSHLAALLDTLWAAKFQIVTGLVLGLLGFLFGRFKLYPSVIERGYRYRQYDEKNRFINGLTQLLTSDSRSVYDCLVTTQNRAGGQFGKDLERFTYALRDADVDKTVIVFNEFTARYRDDLIFVQFMDQIRITYTEGRNNLVTIQQLKDWHGQVKTKQAEFLSRKNDVVLTFKVYYGLSLGLILFLHTVPMPWQMYAATFGGTFVGIGVAIVYVLTNYPVIKKLTDTYFDDNVLSTARS